MEQKPGLPPEIEALWHEVLTNGHRSKYAFLPSSPRCIICSVPFGSFGGRIVSALGGQRPSRKNPNVCNI